MIDGQPGVIIEQTLPPELTDHMMALQVLSEGRSTLMSKERLEEQLEHLLHHPIRSLHDLEKWLHKESLLSEKLQEMAAWVYINFKRHHHDEDAKRHFDEWNNNLLPLIEKYSHQLNNKLINSPYVNQLDQEQYGRLIRSRENAVKLYNEENAPLAAEERQLIKAYNELIGGLSITWEGEERTFQEMQKLLEEKDRSLREQAFTAMWTEVLNRSDQLNGIMSRLVQLRHQMAQNAGFENYRDYIYQKYERYDYSPEDSHRLYQAVRKHVLPAMAKLQNEHRQVLGLADYKPWDIAVQASSGAPLNPFENVDQLINGTIEMFERLDPLFADVVKVMAQEGLLDLENRSGKSPGGFCSSLPLTGSSFIFMNATGTARDMTTMIHEGGHAVHNFLMQQQPLAAYRSADKEAAELASMGMELLTMDHWSVFYRETEALKRAKKEHLQKILSFFPWAMVVDQFQHWMYEHPEHTVEERQEKFLELAQEMSYYGVDIRGMEELLSVRWMLQPHIFEVPFYYIEYVIAQLGAVELWTDYQKDPDGTLTRFKRALALGGSQNLPSIYQEAGLRFELSEQRVSEIVNHLEEALYALERGHLTLDR